MSVHSILERLEGVREIAPNRWVARCPAHDDRSPSFSVTDDNGVILVNCFAGCATSDVMAAIGLGLSDLYEKPLGHHVSRKKTNHWHAARDAFRVLWPEALLTAIAAENMANGIELTQADRDRLLVAAQRIRETSRAVQ